MQSRNSVNRFFIDHSLVLFVGKLCHIVYVNSCSVVCDSRNVLKSRMHHVIDHVVNNSMCFKIIVNVHVGEKYIDI